MVSHDLENLARALELAALQFPVDNANYLELVCNNLHSLAHRVRMLEAVPVAEDMIAQAQ